MTNEEINRRCAEFMGWFRLGQYQYVDSSGTLVVDGLDWNPCESISDAWMLLSKVPQEKRSDFIFHLEEEIIKENDGDFITASVINLLFNISPMAICKAVLKLKESNG